MDLVEYQNNINENRHPWELARLEVIYSFIQKRFQKTENANILDVGCGDTFVVSELQKRMPLNSYYAIDTAFDDALIQDFNHEGIELYKDLSHLEDKIKKADLILLMDVIEHIEDDKSFLKDLLQKDYVNADSLFIITVPAYQSLFSEHDVFLKHYRRYSRKTLHHTLKNTGFEIIESGNFFTSLLAPRILELTKEKLFGKAKAQGLSSWQGSKKQSNILKEVLYLDFKSTNFIKQLGVKLPGLSTYAICRKSV